MKENIALPHAARGAADEACGGFVTLDRLTERRGSAVWRAVGPRGAVALKVGRGEGAAITAREAEVHALLCGTGEGYARGGSAGLAWVMVPWHHGRSTWDALHGVRRYGERGKGSVDVASRFCQAVAALHAAGWVHGDIQPEHVIHGPHETRVIDLSWAHGPGMPPSSLFKGGMVHLLAPEVAGYVEAGGCPVAISPSEEVYTVAASLWWAVTGDWPLDYAAVGVEVSGLSGPALRRVLASGQLPYRGIEKWPEVLNELKAVMMAPGHERPSARELGENLSAAAR